MQWELVVALVIGIPIILFPAAYVWYINIGGAYSLIREARRKRLADREGAKVNKNLPPEQEYEEVLIDAIKRYPWHD